MAQFMKKKKKSPLGHWPAEVKANERSVEASRQQKASARECQGSCIQEMAYDITVKQMASDVQRLTGYVPKPSIYADAGHSAVKAVV